jgi:hypothetical protein
VWLKTKAKKAENHGQMCLFKHAKIAAARGDFLQQPRGSLGDPIDHKKRYTRLAVENIR